MGDTHSFHSRLEKAVSQLKKTALKSAIILHHDEADGLTSAALAKLALEKLQFQTELICLDKLYPEVVSEVEARPGRVIVYADIGSGHVDLLSQNNKGRNTILVLDHHDTTETSDPLVLNINPELDNFSGETDCSSATVAYLFCKSVDPNLSQYAHLALVGAVEVPGEPQGLNVMVLSEGEKLGVATKAGTDYRVENGGTSISRARFASVLNVLGSVGYYRQGPRIGIDACLNGLNNQTLDFSRRLEDERKEANRRLLSMIRESGLGQMKMIQWFHAKDNYEGMSGKVVGSFCSFLRYQRPVNPVKYLVGMMKVPPEIPGWGSLPGPMVKVSGRAPEPLAKMIQKGDRPPLSRILPAACRKAGGFGDGHSVAASGVFHVGNEENFLAEIDRLALG